MSLWQNMTKKLGGAATRNATLRMGGIIGLMGLGSVALLIGGWEVDKPEVPLRDPRGFKAMPEHLGSPLRYAASARDDRVMTREEESTLGTRQYLLRRYKDVNKSAAVAKLGSSAILDQSSPEYRAAKVGESLSLNLNYYPTGRVDNHVPDICWTGSGMQQNFTDTSDYVIKDVKLSDGSSVDVPVKLAVFSPSAKDMQQHPEWKGKESERQTVVAYTFNVNGEYLSQRQKLPEAFYRYSDYPFVFHAKIEVTVNERCSPAEARPVIEAFLREVIPEVTKILPDAKEELAKAQAKKEHREYKSPADQKDSKDGKDQKDGGSNSASPAGH